MQKFEPRSLNIPAKPLKCNDFLVDFARTLVYIFIRFSPFFRLKSASDVCPNFSRTMP